jgi:hypothetical protein
LAEVLVVAMALVLVATAALAEAALAVVLAAREQQVKVMLAQAVALTAVVQVAVLVRLEELMEAVEVVTVFHHLSLARLLFMLVEALVTKRALEVQVAVALPIHQAVAFQQQTAEQI